MSNLIIPNLVTSWILSKNHLHKISIRNIIDTSLGKNINGRKIITPDGHLEYGIGLHKGVYGIVHEYYPFIRQYNSLGNLHNHHGYDALYYDDGNGITFNASYENNILKSRSKLFKRDCTGDIYETEHENIKKYHYFDGVMYNPHGPSMIVTDSNNDIITKIYTCRDGEIKYVKNDHGKVS